MQQRAYERAWAPRRGSVARTASAWLASMLLTPVAGARRRRRAWNGTRSRSAATVTAARAPFPRYGAWPSSRSPCTTR